MITQQISLSKSPIRRSIARFATLCQRDKVYGRDNRGKGDVLMVTRLDRLGRSNLRPLNTVEDIAAKKARYARLSADATGTGRRTGLVPRLRPTSHRTD